MWKRQVSAWKPQARPCRFFYLKHGSYWQQLAEVARFYLIRPIKCWDFCHTPGRAKSQAVMRWNPVKFGTVCSWWNLPRWRGRGSTHQAQWVTVISIFSLERVSPSLFLLPSAYCEETRDDRWGSIVGFPQWTPPASSSCLTRRLFSYLHSHFFLLAASSLKGIKILCMHLEPCCWCILQGEKPSCYPRIPYVT